MYSLLLQFFYPVLSLRLDVAGRPVMPWPSGVLYGVGEGTLAWSERVLGCFGRQGGTAMWVSAIDVSILGQIKVGEGLGLTRRDSVVQRAPRCWAAVTEWCLYGEGLGVPWNWTKQSAVYCLYLPPPARDWHRIQPM